MAQEDKNKVRKVVQTDKGVSEIIPVQEQIWYRQVPSYVAPVYNANACVFICNIGKFITKHELYRLYSPFGGILSTNSFEIQIQVNANDMDLLTFVIGLKLWQQ